MTLCLLYNLCSIATLISTLKIRRCLFSSVQTVLFYMHRNSLWWIISRCVGIFSCFLHDTICCAVYAVRIYCEKAQNNKTAERNVNNSEGIICEYCSQMLKCYTSSGLEHICDDSVGFSVRMLILVYWECLSKSNPNKYWVLFTVF